MQPTFHDSIGRQIGDEHAALHELLRATQNALHECRLDANAFASVMIELRRQVLDHFTHEEQGGYFTEAVEAAPHLGDRAAVLLQEHLQMASELAALQRQSVQAADSLQVWQTLKQRFSCFVMRFEAHEAAENLLLQAAYGEDIGVED